MKLNNENKPDSIKKAKRQTNPKVMNLFWCKVNVKRFGFNKSSSELSKNVAWTAMDVLLK